MISTSTRRRTAAILIGLTAAASSVAACAQSYPSRPIEFISHTSAGSGTDLFARAVSDVITKEKIFPQPITISNRTGGAGVVAFNYIKSKKGDPYAVLAIGTGSFLTGTSRPELGLSLNETFTPLAMFAQDPQAIAVRAESKFKTFRELASEARISRLSRQEPGRAVGIPESRGTAEVTSRKSAV